MSRDLRDERLERLERLTEIPLLVLALLLIPLLVLPQVTELEPWVEDAFLAADWFIWAAFAADLVVKTFVARDRIGFLRSHWLEVVMVVLPFLRPLRIARLLRWTRVLVALGVNLDLLHRIAESRGARFVGTAVLAVVVMSSALVLALERNAPDANITSFGDALWWALVTATTVGYGDHYPTTPEGRAVAAVLMLLGVAAMSVVTAGIAAYLVRQDDAGGDELAAIAKELSMLRREVELLRSRLERDEGAAAS